MDMLKTQQLFIGDKIQYKYIAEYLFSFFTGGSKSVYVLQLQLKFRSMKKSRELDQINVEWRG